MDYILANKKRMKILYVINSSSFFVSHFLGIALNAKKEFDDVFLLAPDDGKKEIIENSGINFVPVKLNRGSGNLLSEVATINQLKNKIGQITPDVIHALTIKPILYTGFILRYLLRAKVKIKKVYSITGLGSSFLSDKIRHKSLWFFLLKLYKQAFSLPDSKVVFENSDDRKLFVELGVAEFESTVIVDGAGVDTVAYYPDFNPKQNFTVVLVARLLKDKGVFEYIEAAKKIKRQSIGIRMLLVGDVDEKNISSMPLDYIKNAHEAGDIEWLGKRNDIADIYRSASIACLPSYREGLPRSLIEAAASGLAIITTNVPGCRQIISKDNEFMNGILVESKSSDAIVNAIMILYENSEMTKFYGNNSRLLALKKFDSKIINDKFISIYTSKDL
ncbi:MAG: glycosyltransferase family 4 protein [Aeromonas sp.]